ncbi:MAG: tetratricopeptide (TPR) repeat protein [Patiriisocius sp.]
MFDTFGVFELRLNGLFRYYHHKILPKPERNLTDSALSGLRKKLSNNCFALLRRRGTTNLVFTQESLFELKNREEIMKYAWNRTLGSLCRPLVCLCLLVAAQSAFAAAERETIYAEVRSFLQNGNSEQAYQTLLKKELSWSGEDSYDYLFGIAALDSGHPGEAVFSLQRLVSRKAGFAGARMELARAYFELGDNELARKEFQRVMADNPPPLVVAAANEYMKAIDDRARTYQSDIQYSIDLGFGYDSNAPAATADDVFLNFTLSPNNLEQSSSFANAAFGAVYSRPLNPETMLLINARLDHRTNPSTHFVDASNVDLGVGGIFTRGDHSISVSMNRIFSWLDRDENKHDTGLNFSYSRKLNKTWNLMTFLRASQVRFEETALQIQDVDRLTYGISISQSFTSGLLNLTATGGADDSQQSGSPFSTDTYGVNASHSWFRPGGKIYFVEAGASVTEYDDPFFGINREDDLYTIGAGAIWAKFPIDDWVTTFKVSHSQKDSTVSLYEFDRLEVGFTFQKLL